MSHYCREITATRDGERHQCEICQGAATEAEIERAYRQARRLPDRRDGSYFTSTRGTGTFWDPSDRPQKWKGRKIKRYDAH